jgi:ABC-2 type transport system ATP-binding protein
MNSMHEPVLVWKGVAKRFGRRPILERVDLSVERGGVTVLLGQNGAGKSTLLRLALGVLRPTAGTVRVFGLDPARDPRQVRSRLGFVPDRPDAFPWMRLSDWFRFMAPQVAGFDLERARTMANALGVPDSTRFGELSRGEGMKAMLVTAVAANPEVLLLDEPFAGLDPLVREDVLRGVIEHLRDGNRTVLCATHDLDVASRIADRVAVLANGRIVQHRDATPEDSGAVAAPGALRDLLHDLCGEPTLAGRE